MKSLQKFLAILFLATLPFVSCTKEDNDPAPTENDNAALKANAGPDQTITLPQDSALLDGSHSSSIYGAITSYEWYKISGPTSFYIVNDKAAKTQVKELINGTYEFGLSVKDNEGRISRDTVQITVISGVENESCDSSNRPIVQAQLLPAGTLSEARAGMAVAAAGNKIVFAGAALSGAGVNGYGSARVDIYDIVTDTWSTAQLSEARSDIAAVAAGNKIFFAGGRLGDGAFDELFSTVDIYDVVADTWTVASLSEPRAYIAAAAVGNKVFFAGGEKNINYETSDKVDIYDLSTNKWSTASLSEPRSYISAVAVDDKIYFAGGQTEDRWYNIPSDNIDIYDNTTDTWSTSTLSQPMGFVAGVAVADNIYWMGGCRMETENVNTGQSSLDYLFKPGDWGYIYNHVVVKDNKLVFFRISGENANKFDIYDLDTKTWSVGVLEQDNVQLRSVFSVNNIIYLAGGMRYVDDNSFELSNQVWKLEF
ncbi:kelch repeat-containing protein [Pontibacter toksunensis]|uniref:Kelch repeat-containing protein n=2 Tax=Pontibacter toksunensis TaxID=1332631 RepID=A0ABW6C0K7_9BACT